MVRFDMMSNNNVAGYGDRGAPPKIPGEIQCKQCKLVSFCLD